MTIPKELREKFHLLQGEEVVLMGAEKGILVKHPTSALGEYCEGSWTSTGWMKT